MGAKPVHERPVDPPDTHASALDSSRNDRFDRGIHGPGTGAHRNAETKNGDRANQRAGRSLAP